MQDSLLYLPIQGVKFSDLFNWGNVASEKSATIVPSPKRLSRQDSKTGAVTDCNGERLAIFRHGEKVFAIDEKCPHAGGPLHLGDIETLPDMSLCVRCPWHSFRFDLQTGQIKHPKGRELLAKVYPIKIEDDGSLLIGFDQINQRFFTSEDF